MEIPEVVPQSANRPKSASPAGKQSEERRSQFSKPDSSTQESLDSDSNVNVQGFAHPQKACAQMISTDEGMQNDERLSHE
jgi:hypothetical protein